MKSLSTNFHMPVSMRTVNKKLHVAGRSEDTNAAMLVLGANGLVPTLVPWRKVAPEGPS